MNDDRIDWGIVSIRFVTISDPNRARRLVREALYSWPVIEGSKRITPLGFVADLAWAERSLT